MKELLKNQYKNVILVCCYIIVSTVVYTVSADCLWDLWFIDLIVGVLVVALGCYIGYKFLKSEEENRLKKLEEANEAIKQDVVPNDTMEVSDSDDDKVVEEITNDEKPE